MVEQSRDRSQEASIRAILDRSIAGWEHLDPEEIMSAIAQRPDTLIWGTDADEVWTGYDSFAAAAEQQVEAFTDPTYRWASDGPQIWMAGDAAFAAGEIRVSLTATGELWEGTMRASFGLLRDDGSWRIVHAHYSIGSDERIVEY